MRIHLTGRVRRAGIAGGLAAATFLVVALSFGPVVRGKIEREAFRRRMAVEVGSVRPEWFGLRLRDVNARLVGVDGARAHLSEVHVALSAALRVRHIDVRGGAVELHGTPETLKDELDRWRAARPRSSGGSSGPSVSLAMVGLSLLWDEPSSGEPRLDCTNVGVGYDGATLGLTAGRAAVRLGSGLVTLKNGRAEIESNEKARVLRAQSLVVEWRADDEAPAGSTDEPRSAPIAASPPVARVALNAPRGAATAATSAPPAAPLVNLPDPRRMRRIAGMLAQSFSDHVPEGVDIGVDALTWRITPSRDQVAFTLGPGPLSIVRAAGGIDLRFTTDRLAAKTPLAVHVVVPNGDSDILMTLDGGPVSLALLGINEGAAGLVDVSRATVTGRARLVLAADGGTITFDGDGATRGVSLASHRLAPAVVSGIDVRLLARGALSYDGELRVDDFEADLGAIHAGAAGTLDQKADHVAGSLRFDLQNADCQALLESVPEALLPTLRGTRMTGQFGASGRFAFDTRSLDGLTLDYAVRDRCRVTAVTPFLARSRFQQPFTQDIYLPNGDIDQRTTGPGSPDWTPLDQISPYMQVAVLTTEDGAFRHHHGFNRAAIRLSLIANLKARRFVRGASTITMQLAKNLYLSREKTLSRKMEEVILTDYLEQTFSKDELMELYLNAIEFGPGVYGIADAADYYFGRSPAELNLAECLFLASVLPAPLRYGATKDKGELSEGRLNAIRRLMRIAHDYGRISDAELAEGEGEAVAFWNGEDRPPPRPPARATVRPEGGTGDGAPSPDPFENVPR